MSDQHDNSVTKLPFRLPSRQELEERRKQIESSKVELHFKPKGISLSQPPTSSTSAVTSLDANATKSTGSSASRPTDTASPRKSGPSTASGAGMSSVGHGDDFDDFNDLGDIPLTDELFDDEHERTGSTAATSTSTPASSAVSTMSSPAATTIQVSGGVTTTPTAGSSSTGGSTSATSTNSADGTAPPPPTVFVPRNKSSIVVSSSQRGNPLLQHIRNVPYEFGQIEPDYIVGLTSCVIFLSIRYHRLHPEYIYNRIAALGKNFVLRVLLVLVDVDTHQQAIRELTRIAVTSELTLICAWSNEEAARYIETYKAYENKPPDAIRERVENDYLAKLSDCLTQVRSVNKTDVVTLSSTFGSFKNIVDASADEIGLLPGFGEQKVKRLLEAFDQPFVVDPHKRKRRRG